MPQEPQRIELVPDVDENNQGEHGEKSSLDTDSNSREGDTEECRGECEDDTSGDQSMIALSPSEHDAFCALWQAVKWDVVPYCHGRIPRPDVLVARYFHEESDTLVFIKRLSKEPFALLKFAFLHKTDLHEGATFETASKERWMQIAQRIRVKRELARPASSQESLEASIEARETRIEGLSQQREDINHEYEVMMAEFEARLAENKQMSDDEKEAIEKMRDLLRQVGELTTGESLDQD